MKNEDGHTIDHLHDESRLTPPSLTYGADQKRIGNFELLIIVKKKQIAL